MMKKILSVVMTITLLLGMSVSSFADDLTVGSSAIGEEKGIFILTDAVPQGASEYAKMIFENLTIDDLSILGICGEEELLLSLGFTVENTEVPIYYFPIMWGNDIEGMVIVIDTENGYKAQVETGNFARNLNNLKTDISHPARIIATGHAYYAIDKSGLQVLDISLEATEEMLKEDKQMIFSEKKNENTGEILSVSNKNTYDVHILPQSYATYENRYVVALVENRTEDGKGVCWAACSGALIDYYEDGKDDSSHAENLREKFIKDKKNETGDVIGGTADIKRYAKEYCNLTLQTVKKLTWNEVKGQKRPIYTHWERSGGAHAMVLEGYKQSTSGNIKQMFIMDPNKKNKILIDYDGAYNSDGRIYQWTKAVTD